MQIKLTPSWVVLFVFIGLSVVMRFFSFFPSVIDHDESTYILIASALLDGSVYWRDIIDTKPVGIFLLFAFFQFLFGKTILMIRIVSAIWIALTAWMLYLVHKQLLKPTSGAKSDAPAIASGVIYIFLTSVFTFFGVSPNTELFFCLFSITALYIVLKDRGPFWMLMAGLLLGIGFIIKYVVLFDALAIGLFYLWQKIVHRKNWTYWLLRCAILGIGFIIPFLLSWLYYFNMDMMDEFHYYSFELIDRYFADRTFMELTNYILDFFLRFLPVTFWFIYCSWNRRVSGNVMPILAWGWGFLAMVIILLPGKLFGHYLVQFMLPFSLLAGSFFDHRRNLPKALAWIRKPSIGYPILILCIVINVGFQKYDYFDKRDYPREIAEWLKLRLLPNEKIYTGNYEQIVYLLSGTKTPTPYVHNSLIWTKAHNYALQIDPSVEWGKILAQKPRYILILKIADADHPFYDQIQLNYRLNHTFENDVLVYERI